MARYGGIYKGWKVPEYQPGMDSMEHIRMEEEALRALAVPLVRFPVADGYAVYAVPRLKPLVLYHIPIGDAYQITAAHMRGLRSKDLQFYWMRPSDAS